MTIYIVFHGTYSDRGTSAVYSNRQDAENYIENNIDRTLDGSRAAHDDFDIEEWDLEYSCPLIRDRSMWLVHMGRDGVTEWADRQPNSEEARSEIYKNFDGKTKLIIYCEARDKEHAIKIANEKRTMLIANGEWEEA